LIGGGNGLEDMRAQVFARRLA